VSRNIRKKKRKARLKFLYLFLRKDQLKVNQRGFPMHVYFVRK